MDELSFLNQYPIFQFILYIIVFVLGTVVYIYYKLSLENKQVNQEHQSDSNQKLIENLQSRIDKLTDDLAKFETERNEVHKRELERTKQLAEAEGTVKLLSLKVEHLERAINSLSDIVKKYETKYGKLDE